MPDICFSDEDSGAWVVAGWAFHQLLDDVISHYPGEQDLKDVLIRAKEVGYLHVDCLDSVMSARVTAAIKRVASGILSGQVYSGAFDRHGHDSTVREYRKGLEMLLEAAPGQSEVPIRAPFL